MLAGCTWHEVDAHAPLADATAPLSLEMLRKDCRCRIAWAERLLVYMCVCSSRRAMLCSLAASVEDLGLALGQ